jgi:hypothetical protein
MVSTNPFTEVALKTAELTNSMGEAERLRRKFGTPEEQAQVKWLSNALVAITPLTLVIGGWALRCLWNWFAAPALNTPQLSYLLALGLYYLLSSMHKIMLGVDARNFDTPAEAILAAHRAFFDALIMPFVYVGIGWCIHWLMLRYN